MSSLLIAFQGVSGELKRKFELHLSVFKQTEVIGIGSDSLIDQEGLQASNISYIVLEGDPKRSGFDFLIRALRKKFPSCFITVISDDRNIKTFEMALRSGADFFCTKSDESITKACIRMHEFQIGNRTQIGVGQWLNSRFSFAIKLKKLSVYVLDDSELMSFALDTGLSKDRRNVVSAFTSVDRFWDAVEKEIPNVVVLDYYLDGGDTGLEVLKSLRKISDDVVAIILSKQEDPEVGVMFLEEGAQHYVVKSKDSVDKIKSILQNY